MWREIVEKQEQHPEAFVDEGTPLMKLDAYDPTEFNDEDDEF